MNKNIKNVLLIIIGVVFYTIFSSVPSTVIVKFLMLPVVLIGAGVMIYVSRL